MKKVMLAFGTRPEAIKMCPLVNELKSRKDIQTVVCVTGQHRQMLDQVLNAFHVVPDYDVSQFGEEEDMHDENGKYLGKKVLFYTEGVYKLIVIGQINNMRVYNEYTIEVKD